MQLPRTAGGYVDHEQVIAAAAVAAFAVLLALAMLVYPRPAEPSPASAGYVPCVTEDAPGPCYWDATRMGNGLGSSFYVDGTGARHNGLPPAR